ncbi:MAG: hypothetical protein V8Q57_10415 [Blautia sp.]
MQVEKRLDQIRSLQAKYGSTVRSCRGICGKCRRKIAKNMRNMIRIGRNSRNSLLFEEKELSMQSTVITRYRKEYAAVLEQKITTALVELNFLQVQFHIEVRQTADYSVNGRDEVELMISTNPGEPGCRSDRNGGIRRWITLELC